MAINVIIKIYDSANNLDFEIPISSEGNSPLSINKELSDLSELTKRSGVQSRRFKIPISKDVAIKYDNFNSAQHTNGKDVDGDKEAAIIIDGNEFERGKARITDFVNKAGFESVTLLFFGDNFDWTELGKNMTMSDIDWTVNSFTFSPENVKATWTNTVDGGDEFVYPLENRGGRKQTGMVHTEDFRVAFFLHSVFTRFFQNIGYTIDSDFINTANFKKLVLTSFGRKWNNTTTLMEFHRFRINVGGSLSNLIPIGSSYINKAYNTIWDDSTAPSFDTNNLFDVNAVDDIWAPSPASGVFTAQAAGYYEFKIGVTIDNFNLPSFLEVDFRCRKRGLSPSFLATDHIFIGTGSSAGYHSGSVTVYMKTGETVAFLTASNTQFRISDCFIECNLTAPLAEGSIFNFQDILDDQIKILDIINDVSRMFNLVFETDIVLRQVKIEPRDDFYNAIETAEEITDLIDITKPIKTVFNSSAHKRDMIFSYKKDSSDKFVTERDKEKGTALAEYSHNLPNKFKEGVTTIKTSVLAASYFLKDTDSIAPAEADKAPWTTRYWNTFSTDSPVETLDGNAPRILNYVYGIQLKGGIGAVLNQFRFYDETVNRNFLPVVLAQEVYNDTYTIVPTPINLFWHELNGKKGLFANHWSKTVTEIVNGIAVSAIIRIDSKFWNNFKFRNILYIQEPIEIKGYWVAEKLSKYQPENSNLCEIKLLHRVEYDLQVEIPPVYEDISIKGRFAVEEESSAYNMTMAITDADGNEVNVLMETTDTSGNKTTLKA